MKSVEITNKLIQVSSMPRPFMPVVTHIFAQDRRLIMVVVLPVAVSRSFKSLQHHGKLCATQPSFLWCEGNGRECKTGKEWMSTHAAIGYF